MKFEARSLRVQLPCKSVTVIDADEHDAQLQARQYWRAIALEAQAKFGAVQRQCEECSGNPAEPLCQTALPKRKRGLQPLRVHRRKGPAHTAQTA